MAKKFTNVETYLGVIFIFLIMVTGLIYLGGEVINNTNANLDNDSYGYIANLTGINLSQYDVDSADVESPILTTSNSSQGNSKDQSLEFLFAKEKGVSIEIVIKSIYSLPQIILIDLLRFDLGSWSWIIGLFNWLYRLLIIITLIYFVRGLIR